MEDTLNTQRSLVLSYLGLRKCIGTIGILLPFGLALGKWVFDSPGLLDSISAYYHSVMRDVLVGSLCAIAVFLFSYRYRRLDDIAGDIAGASAIGVALFPAPPLKDATEQQNMIGIAHTAFALLFFLTLAYFALVLFRKTNPDEKATSRKHKRNSAYLVCGSSILLCLALIALVRFLPGNLPLQQLDPIFWLEALAILAFGIAWFVKGETILKDEERGAASSR